MFILSTLALMGAQDQLMQVKGKGEVWARLGWWERLGLWVSTYRDPVVLQAYAPTGRVRKCMLSTTDHSSTICGMYPFQFC